MVLASIAAAGLALFVWQLGSTGLVDETPPLFAAAARAMARSGDWLTPRVNGLPRYDKPPLVYWLMGLGYALPGQPQWDQLGSWAARLPSALSSIAVMLGLGSTLLRWPQPLVDGRAAPRPAITAISAALAFALSPLVLIWSRIAVSDALFSALLAISLLLFWRCYAAGGRPWPAWLVLGLDVLAKGPVAVVLAALCLAGFGWWQQDLRGLWGRLRPWPGLALTALLALPWYGLELLVEGQPFLDSFFGYHNLQRFTGVVNHHLQPWWYFLPVALVASFPFTPLLLLGLAHGLRQGRRPLPPAHSLGRFATCWLLAVLLFFTLAATKLPSYWIPATPAAGILIALAAQQLLQRPHGRAAAAWFGGQLALLGLFTAALAASPSWIPWIREPELPGLNAALLASGAPLRATLCAGLALLFGLLLWRARGAWHQGWLLAQQLAFGLFVLTALQPLVILGDQLRQLPVRRIAAAAVAQRRPDEPLAMVGILKPSLHFYTDQVVLYEGVQVNGPLNLDDRLQWERRPGQVFGAPLPGTSLLLVIDRSTAQLPHWRGLPHQPLAAFGLYQLWRVDRLALRRWAAAVGRSGAPAADWRRPRPERY